ncbi:hypothetical protein ACFL15_00505 [Patescibacteria group bacterium]
MDTLKKETEKSQPKREFVFIGSVQPKEIEPIPYTHEGKKKQIAIAKFNFTFPLGKKERFVPNLPENKNEKFVLVLPYNSPFSEVNYEIDLYEYIYEGDPFPKNPIDRDSAYDYEKFFGVLRPTNKSIPHIVGPIMTEKEFGNLW